MQKKWNRLLLVALAAITVFVASTVFVGAETADSKYELHDSSWYLSEEEARAFMGFIYNLGPDDLDKKEFAGLAVDLLSGKYADSPEDEYIIKAAVCEVALTQINSKVRTYDHASVISSENLISWLQSQVGDNPNEQYINSTCNGYLEKMKESLKKTLLICNLTDDEYAAYEDFDLCVSGFETIIGIPNKAKKYVETVKAGVEAVLYAGSSSRSAMYKYVLSYVKTRDLAKSTVDGFELAMDYNVVALVNQGLYDPFLNWAAEDNQKVLNRFAELLYWLCEDIGGISFENDNASGNSTSTAEPVEFVPGTGEYKGSCGSNVKWHLDASTGVLSVYGSGAMYDYGSASKTPWYNYRQYINYVKVADGVTNVGNCAFSSCTVLDKVYLSADVVSIGRYAFSGCQSLRIIAIDGNVSNIGSYAFQNCSNLVYFKVPDGVTTIGSGAFYCCSNLANIDLPDGITSIGDKAFYCCEKLTSVNLTEGLLSIGKDAFVQCYELKTVNGIPSTVTYIGEWAFSNCWQITDDIVIPEGITEIYEQTFGGCKSIASVVIPNSVTKIGARAFSGCARITELVIPESVTYLPEYAFSGCESLKDLTIPASIGMYDFYNISYHTFYGCNNIEKVTLTKGTGTMVLGYRTRYPWHFSKGVLKEVIIEDGVTNIGDEAFYDCISLEKVDVPDSITTIGSGAFYCCSNLANIDLPDGITSIGDKAFYCCEKLTSVNLTEGLLSIGKDAFVQCYELKTVNGIPSTVTYIGEWAFSNCWQITDDIVIPEGITEIYEQTFGGCKSIASVVIPNSVTKIGARAFSGCARITELVIPESVTYLPEYAFSGCESLKDLTIPASIGMYDFYNISYHTFYGCNNIEKVTLTKGTGTMVLGYRTRYPWHFSKGVLKEVIIEDGVTNIGDEAFYDCIALETVILPDSITSIGNYAFYNCTSLTELTIPNKDCTIFDSSSTVYSKTTIKAACGSKAYDYAVKYKRSFVSTEHTPSDWFAEFLSDGETMTTNIYRQCTYCGEVLDLTTHTTKGWVVDSAATCTQDGSKHLECLDCQRRIDTAIPALGHTPVIDPAVDATCTETGFTEGSHCSVCGEVLTAQEEIPALGHTYGEYVVTTEPTCTESGVETKTCSVCGDEQIRPVAARGHTEVTDPAKRPTCTETGLTEGSHCSVCGKVLTAQEEIPALGHTDTNADGKCDNCGETMEAVKTCTCNCHKTGFAGFIYKIMRIFWKLFRINKTCACGMAHY